MYYLPPCNQVIPQLIARIDTPRALVGRLIHQLLTDIGRYHPQVYIKMSNDHYASVIVMHIEAPSP